MSKSKELPSGQLTLAPVMDATEGRELLEPVEVQRELYPLTTVERNQERLQSIIDALAAGTPLAVIIKEHRVGWHTLKRIQAAHGLKITDSKKRLANDMRYFAAAGVEVMTEALLAGQMDPDKLFMSVGTLTDKALLLDGDPSVIVGSSDGPRRFSLDDLNSRLRRRRDIIDVTPTGSAGADSAQTREGAGRRQDRAVDVGRDSAASDIQSDNNQ